MMARFRISLMAAALFGLATLGVGRTAEAALRLQITAGNKTTGEISEDDLIANGGTLAVEGGTATLVVDPLTGVSIVYEGLLDGVSFALGVLGVTNEPGETYFGFVELNGSFTNSAGTSRAISIKSWADAFMTPVTPPSITQVLSVSGSVRRGAIVGGQGTGEIADDVPNISNVATSLINATGPGSISTPNVTKSIPNLTAPYTFTTSFTASLTNNTQVTGFAVTNTLTKPVPEPTTIAIAGVGVVLSMGALRRQKRS